MNKTKLNQTLVIEHRRQLDSMETPHLVEMWNTTNEVSWTAEGIEAIRQLLTERIGVVPVRRDPSDSSEPFRDEDTYHDPDKLMSISSRLSGLSWLFLVLALLSALMFILLMAASISAGDFSSFFLQNFTFSIASLLPFLQTSLIAISVTFILRAIAEGILLLMDIEDNTRGRVASP